MSLDKLQDSVSNLQAAMQKLVGRPILEVVEQWTKNELLELEEKLPTKVYIEPEVCGPGPKLNFEVCEETNPSVSVTDAFSQFMRGPDNVLLLSGPAGSSSSARQSSAAC